MGRPEPHQDGPVGRCQRSQVDPCACGHIQHGYLRQIVGARGLSAGWWWRSGRGFRWRGFGWRRSGCGSRGGFGRWRSGRGFGWSRCGLGRFGRRGRRFGWSRCGRRWCGVGGRGWWRSRLGWCGRGCRRLWGCCRRRRRFGRSGGCGIGCRRGRGLGRLRGVLTAGGESSGRHSHACHCHDQHRQRALGPAFGASSALELDHRCDPSPAHRRWRRVALGLDPDGLDAGNPWPVGVEEVEYDAYLHSARPRPGILRIRLGGLVVVHQRRKRRRQV